jgi:hypothetical protein
MRVVLQLNGTPDWVHPKLAATVPDAMERVWYPPVRDKELDHWADFVTDIVTRYRGDVAQYEIWNEPNHPPFWRPAPNVTEYARLLRRAYEAAREADPRATIVFGGLAQNSIGYLEAFYDAVDRIWPARRRNSDYFFDVLGSHPYSGDRSPRVLDPRYSHSDAYGEVDENFLGFRRLRAVVQRRDASSKPIYIGEFGYPTGMISDETRAQYLADAYQLAAGEGYVTGLSWYSFVPDSTNTGGWPIVDPNLTPSLTFQALRAVDTGR